MRALAVATVLVSGIAAASQCDAPPFGDTQQNYDRWMKEFSGVSPDILRSACRAKFEHDARAFVYLEQHGVDDAAIRTGSTTTLAQMVLSPKADQPPIGSLPRPPSPPPSPYRLISVGDFVLDATSLSRTHEKIRIPGQYIKQGGVEYLYESQQAISYEVYAGSSPAKVPLLVEDAPRGVRAHLLGCQSGPITAQLGCPAMLSGQVVDCELNNAFGTTRQVKCLQVQDGSDPSAN